MIYVAALTNNRWFEYLRARGSDEVNFWSPGAQSVRALPGTPWLFKLHAPLDYIVGGGYFVQHTRLPLRVAWDTFGDENGAATYDDFKRMIGKSDPGVPIGCTVLCETFYWPEERWLRVPPGFKKNIQRYMKFDTADDSSAEYWQTVGERLQTSVSLEPSFTPQRSVGKPVLHIPRLGQGAFRAGIIDAYGRRCTVTGERTLPALEAAHIVPFAETQRHELRNGLLLRADLHKLFDDGYVTVDANYRFHVSRRIRDEYKNGRDYYALDGREIRLPEDRSHAPDQSYLAEHATRFYKG